MRLNIGGFFSDIANFVHSGSALGLDIGTTSIKIAELSQKGDRLRLENYGVLESKEYLEHPNQAIQTSSLKLVEKEAAPLVRGLLNEMGTKSRLAVVSVPAFSVFVTPLEMPLISLEETAKSIPFQAKQYIPLPISEVAIDWFRIEEFDDSRGQRLQRILLIGVPKELIARYKTLCHEVGLKIQALEIETLALVRALQSLDLVLIVDVGGQSSNIAISDKGILKYNSQSDYGGFYLTQALSRSLGISAHRAEELKRRRGLLGSGGELELSTLMPPFIDVIIQDVKHAMDMYERRYGSRPEKLLLTGGGANLLGIEKYIVSQMGLKLVSPQLFGSLDYPPGLEPTLKSLTNSLSVAVGLAKRYYS